MNLKKILVVATAILFLLSAGAMAQSGKTDQTKKTPFAQMDKNGDGKVSKDEYKSYFKDQYAAIKGDKPEITVESFQAYYVVLFKELDKSGDKRLDKTEHEVPGRIDKNGDGVITLDEWNAFIVEHVKVIDKDKNGKVSEEEYDVFYNVNFKALDANGDGVITVDEWIANVPKAEKTKAKAKDNKAVKKTAGK